MNPENNFQIQSFLQPFDVEAQRRRLGTEPDVLGRFRSTISGFESLPGMADRIGQELMLPQQRENVLRLGELTTGLQNQLLALPEQVQGRSRESIVTAPQLARMVQAEAQPLQQSLAQLGGLQELAGQRLGMSEQQLGQRMGLEQAQQERQLLPFEMEFNAEQQLQAREFSGYTFQNQSELDRLIANQNAGLTWTNAERNRAQELALQEMQYENALKQISAKGEQQRLTKRAPGTLADLYQAFVGS